MLLSQIFEFVTTVAFRYPKFVNISPIRHHIILTLCDRIYRKKGIEYIIMQIKSRLSHVTKFTVFDSKSVIGSLLTLSKWIEKALNCILNNQLNLQD